MAWIRGYSGDLNTDHLNTELFEVWISNDWVFNWSVYVICLCTRPTIPIPDQYIWKQDGVHLISYLLTIECYGQPFEIWTKSPVFKWFLPFKIQPSKSPVFKWFRFSNGQILDPHCSSVFRSPQYSSIGHISVTWIPDCSLIPIPTVVVF